MTSHSTVMHVGDDGYRQAARDIAGCFRRVEAEVRRIPQLVLLTNADLAVVPVTGAGSFDIYALATLLEEKGWGIFTGQKPKSLAIPIGEQTAGSLDAFFADLHAAVDHLLAHPEMKPRGNPAIYGAASTLPQELIDSILRGYVDLKMKVKPKA